MGNGVLANNLIQAVNEADSSVGLVKAVQQLAAARMAEGIPTLIAALGYNNPGAAVAAVDGLIQLGEAAVGPLLELLDGYNYSARAWAIRALAEIGDPRALPTLINAVETDFALSVRRSAAKGLGNLHWQQLPTAQIDAAQEQAFQSLSHLVTDPEWVVRYATIVGLELLAGAVSTARLKTAILQQIQLARMDVDLTVRSRAILAQQHLSQ